MPPATRCKARRPAKKGSTLARGGAFDVILSDMRMPGMSGLDVLRTLRERRVDSGFIIMTGFGTVDTAVEAMKLGAVDFVQKPFFRDELLMRVRAAAERRQLARQVDLLQRHIRAERPIDGLIGESAADGAGQGPDPPRRAAPGRCSSPAKQAPARNSWRARSTPAARAPRSRSSRSTAPR